MPPKKPANNAAGGPQPFPARTSSLGPPYPPTPPYPHIHRIHRIPASTAFPPSRLLRIPAFPHPPPPRLPASSAFPPPRLPGGNNQPLPRCAKEPENGTYPFVQRKSGVVQPFSLGSHHWQNGPHALPAGRQPSAAAGADGCGVDPDRETSRSGTSRRASSGNTNEVPVILGSWLIRSGYLIPGSAATAKISCTAASNLRKPTIWPLVISMHQTPHDRSSGFSRSVIWMPLKTADSRTCDRPMKARCPTNSSPRVKPGSSTIDSYLPVCKST